jgi:ppGpp synthetase/RelA/SpoT-type nucleotidyltranferase
VLTPVAPGFRNQATSSSEDEEPWLAEMEWATPKFPRNQVDKAGCIFANEASSLDQLVWSYDVINNWRASHSFPLNNFQNNLRVKIKNLQADVLVAQRIKRLESIRAKLIRDQTNTMQLSQMQDIGGCRAIVKSLQNVNKLVLSYKRSTFSHKLKSEKDYISSPKADGYRGYHLVYQYQGSPMQIRAYDKLRIEIQIRSGLQHAWATAVEAVGAFTRQALKSNQGNQEWLRLFSLMGSAMAHTERTPYVPGTPTDYEELKSEIKRVSMKLHAVETLEAHRATLNYVGSLNVKTSKYLLVYFDLEKKMVFVEDFAANASQAANLAYTQKETNKKEGDNIVLVKVDSLRLLTKAYPNFFLDTQQFTEALKGVIHGASVADVAAQLS